MKRWISALVKCFIGKTVRFYIDKEVHHRLLTLDHLHLITETQPDDVFIVGYPKSGHTWFQNLIAGVVYGANPECLPDRVVQDLIPDVHRKRYYKRYRNPMFFKSHHLPDPSYRRIVYLLRDGRDVMVSYHHFLQSLHEKEIDFQEIVGKSGSGSHQKWHEHVNSWVENPFNAQMIIIKFEDLKHDPVNELRRFCDFVNVDCKDDWLDFVARKSDFQTMRWKEQHYGWDNPKWPRDKFFVRRGAVGSYKDEMPPDVLDIFLCDARSTLLKFGYL